MNKNKNTKPRLGDKLYSALVTIIADAYDISEKEVQEPSVINLWMAIAEFAEGQIK